MAKNLFILLVVLSSVVVAQDNEFGLGFENFVNDPPFLTAANKKIKFKFTHIGASLCRDVTAGCDRDPVYEDTLVFILEPDDEFGNERLCWRVGLCFRDCDEDVQVRDYSEYFCWRETDGQLGLRNALYLIEIYRFEADYFGNRFWNLRNQTFYDNRHSYFPREAACLPTPCMQTANDISFRYDVDNNAMWYIWDTANDEPLNGFWTEINKNEVLNWWEIADCPDYDASLFDAVPWPELNEITTDAADHPVLTWEPPVNWSFTVQKYEIERAIIKTTGPNSFQKIHTETNINNRTYTDLSMFVPSIGGKLAEYRVKAIFAEESSAPQYSNIRKINVSNQPSLVVEDTSPRNFVLDQNYPNPFNPSTTFRFSIPEDDYVSLKIYNLNGQEVAELTDEYRSPGEHSVPFDAGSLAAGTYFYTLTSGMFSETRKFTLVK